MRLSFPPELPVSRHVEQIVSALREHQVLVVAGHTGSGKTTQLPKMCLQAGFGKKAQIAHTQPRRLAAVTVAGRIAEEMQCELGKEVGYQIRFDKHYAKGCRVKLMTDGVLLNEIHRDRQLRCYDCIIIDEAHERSLNIDFLLGYLKRLCKKRPALRVVVTSATIDTQRFSDFFDGAPIIEVAGKTHPVEVLYRPPADDSELNENLLAALKEIQRHPLYRCADSNAQNILCFLSTEQEIHDASRFLRGRLDDSVEVLPLYARLPARQQARVFQPGVTDCRVILATNIAETSVTVPGVGFVIDTGYARISRYSVQHKIQQLPIEPIAQASANQRSGRCGRLGPGLCIRVYDEQSFSERPEFTEPEILRTNLAAVILRLRSLGVADLERFEFVDQPDGRLLRDGLRLLQELQALQPEEARSNKLTDIGRQLARLPIEPRLGRVLLAAATLNCLPDALIICAALSSSDPRERPSAQRDQADRQHARFKDPRSDFLSYLKLWRHVQQLGKKHQGAALRKQLRREYLSAQAVSDWQDVHVQLQSLVQDVGLKSKRKQASYENIHRSILAGFVTNIGVLGEKRWYTGTRQRQFRLFPGSALAAKPPPMMVAAEIVETSSVYARVAAKIKSQWALDAAHHLVQREYSEPFFDTESGTVKALEAASLQGLNIASERPVDLHPHKPAVAREIFIAQGIVQGLWQCDLPFAIHNAELVKQAEQLAAKLRRPELLCTEEAQRDRFETQLPLKVNSVRGFERWYAGLHSEQQACLQFSLNDFLVERVPESELQRYPDVIQLNGNEFAVRYRYCPGEEEDGIEVLVPEFLRPTLPDHAFDDLVPGWFELKCIALLKSLPKRLRKPLVPIADTVRNSVQELHLQGGPLLERLQYWLANTHRVVVEVDDWDLPRVPDYFFARVSILNASDQLVSSHRAWPRAVQAEHPEARTKKPDSPGQTGMRTPFAVSDASEEVLPRSFPHLPEAEILTHLRLQYRVYPGLTLDEQDRVVKRRFFKVEDARRHSAWALARLYQRALPEQARLLRGRQFQNNQQRLELAVFPDPERYREDCIQRVFYEIFGCDKYLPRDPGTFQQQLKKGRSVLVQAAEPLEELFAQILSTHYETVQGLQSVSSSYFKAAVEDVKQQLKALLCKEFLATVTAEQLAHYPRYLRAAARRLARLREQQGRDAQQQLKIGAWESRLWAELGHSMSAEDWLSHPFYWLLQEYRVSLFAQSLGTAQPVSETRLKAAWQQRHVKPHQNEQANG